MMRKLNCDNFLQRCDTKQENTHVKEFKSKLALVHISFKETKCKIWRTDLRRYQYYGNTFYSPEEGES